MDKLQEIVKAAFNSSNIDFEKLQIIVGDILEQGSYVIWENDTEPTLERFCFVSRVSNGIVVANKNGYRREGAITKDLRLATKEEIEKLNH